MVVESCVVCSCRNNKDRISQFPLDSRVLVPMINSLIVGGKRGIHEIFLENSKTRVPIVEAQSVIVPYETCVRIYERIFCTGSYDASRSKSGRA